MTTLVSPNHRHWRVVRLGDVCEKITDGTHHSPSNGPAGAYKYITAKNIKLAGLDLTNVTYIDAATHREIYARCDVRKNDVLYVKDGATTGRVALNTLEEEFSLLSSVSVLRPNREALLPKFLLYALQSPTVKDRMLADVAGVAITRLTLKKLNAAEIPLVPIEYQAEIVAEIEKQFSRLDEAVANLKRVKANLKHYKAAVLKAAVEGRLVPTEAELARREDRAYETGDELLNRILEARRKKMNGKGKFKESAATEIDDLPDLPLGWSYSNGAQLFDWSSGVNLPVKNLAGGNFPVYGGNGINGWHSKANVTYPTLVIGRVGAGCGNVNVVNQHAWVTDNAIYAISVPTDCSLSFLGMVLTVANLNSVAAGSGQPFVNQTILNETVIALPPRLEQIRIVDEVERHLSLIRGVETQTDANLKRAEVLRQSVLSKSFSEP